VVTAVFEYGQPMARGQYRDARAAALALDVKVERMLEKRRWVLAKAAAR
jgi:hypothetical protein